MSNLESEQGSRMKFLSKYPICLNTNWPKYEFFGTPNLDLPKDELNIDFTILHNWFDFSQLIFSQIQWTIQIKIKRKSKCDNDGPMSLIQLENEKWQWHNHIHSVSTQTTVLPWYPVKCCHGWASEE